MIVRTNHHLPCKLVGDRIPLSLLTSSSTSFPSTQRALLLTLTSELALLLVASGESKTLIALLLVGPDLTLYMEDAGMLVISGRRLPGIVRLISCSNKNSQINLRTSWSSFIWEEFLIVHQGPTFSDPINV